MRIVKYILTDALSIILFTALFLFNPDNDGKVNIMIAMIIGFVASCAEMILVLYYLVSSLLNIYKKNVHILIFCLLCLSINIASILEMQDDVIGSYFYGVILTCSIILIIVYNRIVLSINHNS
jgi:Kef-type K+ transport system membrane component KefB